MAEAVLETDAVPLAEFGCEFASVDRAAVIMTGRSGTWLMSERQEFPVAAGDDGKRNASSKFFSFPPPTL
jgi:hypothetical protein